ncbi:unnamed protein product [Gongylonema pulchrum]|uniref:STPPase_N domain-containing protein n=1 Tax=Gongylonema pulchrum TaxID=637853 RepID=A0A183ETR3_9BILA|nr:unnamed protein product [Gongylonema pulchrum]
MANANDNAVDLDSLISRLLEARGRDLREMGPVQIAEGEMLGLLSMSKEVFLAQSCLMDLMAPITICGQRFLFSSS